MRRVCDVCGKIAIYYSRESGVHYCKSCLERSVEKRVKKELSRVGITRGDKVLIYLPLFCQNAGSLFLSVYLKTFGEWRGITTIIFREGNSGKNFGMSDLSDNLLERASWISRGLKVKKVLLPLPKEVYLLLFLSAFSNGKLREFFAFHYPLRKVSVEEIEKITGEKARWKRDLIRKLLEMERKRATILSQALSFAEKLKACLQI